jgi:hypothetical protein
MKNMKNIYKFLVGNPEMRRPFGRPRPIMKDNIKTELK